MKLFKSIVSIILVSSMLLTTAFADNAGFTATDAARAFMGENDLTLDVNGDGVVDANDAAQIMKKVLDSDYVFTKADTTTTEKVTETTTKSSSSDDNTQATTEKASEATTDATTEKVSETTTKSSSSEDNTQTTTEKVTEATTEATTEKVTEETTETTTVDASYYKDWTFADVSTGAISSATTIDGLELFADSTNGMEFRARERELDGKSYANSLNLKGTGSTSKRNVSFDVKGSTKLTIVSESGNASSERTLNITDASGNILATAKAQGITKTVINLSYTGKIYIYSAGSGIDIYEIIREAASSSDTETSTEATTATTTEIATETTTSSSDPSVDNSEYGVQGFASSLADLDTSGYTTYEVSNEADFLNAVNKANSGNKVIIKVMADLNLGYNEVSGASKISNFKELLKPLTHPTLIASGVSQITIGSKVNGLIIYSPSGNKIKHTDFVLSGAQNVIFRNITFCELWEWDEESFGHYDRNDWDFIGIQSTSKNIWLDHCTFTRSYDGAVDSKAGSYGLSITWCKFDAEEDREFIKAQIDYLEEHIDDATASIKLTNGTGSAIESLGLTADSAEQTTKYNYALYRYLRKEVGITTDELVEFCMPQQKTHLVGASDTEKNISNLEITLAYNYYKGSRDRLPRLRGGNAHVYNCVIDSTGINDVYNKYSSNEALTNITKISFTNKWNNNDVDTWDFSKTNQAFVSTVDGAFSAENCVLKNVKEPIKNNQKSSDATYTGKFRALNVLFDGVLTTWDGTQDAIDNDTSNKLYPKNSKKAATKVFSWNKTPNNPEGTTPSYKAVDPTVLEEKLDGHVGAGVLELDWTKTTY